MNGQQVHRTFIALCIHHQSSFTVPVGTQPFNYQWEGAVIQAIQNVNEMHDELFGGEGIDVAVDDAIIAAGDQCHVSGILRENNVFGSKSFRSVCLHDRLNSTTETVSKQYHVLTVNNKTMLIVVDCDGTLALFDSHIHGCNGVLIAWSDSHQHQQGQAFAAWLNQMLIKSMEVFTLINPQGARPFNKKSEEPSPRRVVSLERK